MHTGQQFHTKVINFYPSQSLNGSLYFGPFAIRSLNLGFGMIERSPVKMNPDKCHVMILVSKTFPEDFTILVDDTALIVDEQMMLSGVALDNKLKFNANTFTRFAKKHAEN